MVPHLQMQLFPCQRQLLSSADKQVRIQRGDRGSGPPPGKSQVIWVSIGNKQLDPPPPPLENVGPPKKNVVRAFFVRLTWTPPPLPKIPGSAHVIITFANSLDPDQDRQNLGPGLIQPVCLFDTLIWFLIFFKENIKEPGMIWAIFGPHIFINLDFTFLLPFFSQIK